MKFEFDCGDRVKFKKFGEQQWYSGVVVGRELDVVHAYGDDLTTHVYTVRTTENEREVCILWDSIESDNPLEELARI